MEFAFEIGQVVRHAVSQNQTTLVGYSPHKEIRGIVEARIAEECTAGVQRHYLVRWVRFDGMILNDACLRHHEIELVASEPFPAAGETEA